MYRGDVDIEWFDCQCLKNNPLGDPSNRPIVVYKPPAYDQDSSKRYPTIYLLSGFLGTGRGFLAPQPWGFSIEERCDLLIEAGKMEPCLIVMPDGFNRWGGGQYLNSDASGLYEDYISREVVDFVDKRYRTIPDASSRALIGKSSGGYAALRLAANHPDIFSAFFCHSGDMYFEYAYKPDIPKCYSTLVRAGGLEAFVEGHCALAPRL